MRLFAIRASAHNIELRASRTPIKGLQTTAVHRVVEQYRKRIAEGVDSLGYPRFRSEPAERIKKLKITSVSWTGGRKLGVFGFNACAYNLKLRVFPDIGRACEVDPKIAKLALTAAWRDKHLAGSR